MKRSFKNTSFHKTVAALLLCGLAQGADISSVGGWTLTITAANLVAGAGSDLTPSFESINGTASLSILGLPSGWTVRARRGAGSWHSGVSVLVRRASDGSGPGGSSIGSVAGGESFIELTSTDTVFFTGTHNRDGIALQYKLTGVSCDVPPATYSAPIIFTIQ